MMKTIDCDSFVKWPHLTSQKLLADIDDRQKKRGSASFEKLLPLETGPLS